MGVDEEMNKLSSTLTTIQAVLEDAEEKQLEDKAIRNWLCKLNDLTYEIDDILDECSTEVSKLEHKSNKAKSYLKNILYRYKIGRRMKEVTKKLNEIAAERAQFHLREMPLVERQSCKVASIRETCSVINESHPIYGRDEEKEKIVDILVNKVRECKELSILPIIGIGGLGKTTLAQLVFNDEQVAGHFDIKIWVCVSDNFDYKTLIKAILESASGSGSASDMVHLDTLQRRLSELLSQKRYLIVLDDVWNEDQEEWSVLKSFLACGSSGASIIVTTRLKSVAGIMSTFPSHQLTGLSEEDCWFLFKKRAFERQEEEGEYPNLEAIGKQIVKKCVGVPLAAKTLGGLLRFKRNEKEWSQMKESEIWDLPQTDTSILPALRLSYNHLPLRLRQCFAFCAIYPKDSVIEKKKLILMWVAHGCISATGTMEVEDIGNEIWNELVLRCLFQDVSTRYMGEVHFKMHDLVHDLAQSIMENKVLGTQVEINNRSAPNTKVRQVNLKYDSTSVAFPTRILPEMDLTSALMSYSRLRILNACVINIDNLPSEIGKLKHLRCLNLSYTHIRSLPNAICSLWNLKILNLNYCSKLVRLPKNMRYMRNLRHLFLEGCNSLSEMPPSIGELASLQTLSFFIVGHEKTNQLKELELLNLGGKFVIKHLERVKNFADAKKANLAKKQNLCVLSLQWEVDDNASNKSGGEDVDEKVFEALHPHPNLKKLWVSGFKEKSRRSAGRTIEVDSSDEAPVLSKKEYTAGDVALLLNGKLGHFIKDCPYPKAEKYTEEEKKQRRERREKRYQKSKVLLAEAEKMAAIYSSNTESGTSSDDSVFDETPALLCLMAKESDDSDNEVILSESELELFSSFEQMMNNKVDVVNELAKLKDEMILLKKQNTKLKLKVEKHEESAMYKKLSHEYESLKAECEVYKGKIMELEATINLYNKSSVPKSSVVQIEKPIEQSTPLVKESLELNKAEKFIFADNSNIVLYFQTAKSTSLEIKKKEKSPPKAKKGKKPENEKQTGKTKQQSSPKKSADKSKTNQTSKPKSSVKEQVKSRPKKQRNYNNNAWYGNESYYVQPAYPPYYAAPHYPPHFAAYPAHQPMHAYPAYHASYPAYEPYPHHNDYQHNMPADYDENEVAHAPVKTQKPRKPKTSTSWVVKGDTNPPGPSQ
ncbi:hypothetical protein RD792_000348 [Penstemon davidsonii]|uniref:Uncharacterized protein n=1 Tax=Penstemon davidsonii TaxID=160366 RepID=A0ABR0DKE3_9LAMI|nr:hypothetical protein RD792_000348 [Penstemon davidsonii]